MTAKEYRTRRTSLEQQRQIVQQALSPLDRAREAGTPVFDAVTANAYATLRHAYYALLAALTDLDSAHTAIPTLQGE